MVNFTPPAALPPGKEPRYPLNRRLGGPHSRSERLGRREESLASGEILTLDRPARILVTISTTLSRKRRVYIGCVYCMRWLC